MGILSRRLRRWLCGEAIGVFRSVKCISTVQVHMSILPHLIAQDLDLPLRLDALCALSLPYAIVLSLVIYRFLPPPPPPSESEPSLVGLVVGHSDSMSLKGKMLFKTLKFTPFAY